MIESLERAVELEPNPQSLTILADAYARVGDEESVAKAEKLRKKAETMIIPAEAPKKVQQPRRVVM